MPKVSLRAALIAGAAIAAILAGTIPLIAPHVDPALAQDNQTPAPGEAPAEAAPADPAAGRHPLPDPEVFAEGMAALGIGDDDTVVAYDDAGGVIAARLVWMLRVTGHEAALLDGGLTAWDGPLEQAAPDRAPAVFTPRPWPAGRLAGVDDVPSGR